MRGVVEADAPAVFALISARGIFAPAQRDAWFRYARWAYWDNPFRGDLPPGWVVEEGGGVVAYVGCVFMPFRIGQWSGAGGSVENLTVDASVRGPLAVLFTRDHLRAPGAPVQFAGHFTAKGTQLWQPFRAVECPGTDTTYVATLSEGARLQAKVANAGTLGRLAAATGLPYLSGTLLPRGGSLQRAHRHALPVVSKIADLPEAEVDALCAAATADLNAYVRRDARYLRWRYEERPDAKAFRTIVTRSGDDNLTGLAVLQDCSPLDQRICEFLTSAPFGSATAETLLAGVAEASRRKGGAVLRTKMVREELAPFWAHMGFQREVKPNNQYLVASALPDRPPAPLHTMYTYAEAKLW